MLNNIARARLRRRIIATYPDGAKFEIRKTDHGWQYHPRGSCASPLSVAKAEARAEGAVIKSELV